MRTASPPSATMQPPPTVPPARGRGPWTALRSSLQGSPGRLRLVAAATALVIAVFGLVAGNTLWSSSGALGRADHDVTQLVRVQSIYADLLQADASASNAFLVGGLEPATQRATYDAAVARVTTAIAQAATAQPADAEALGVLNGQVQQYTATIEQARTLNRQGLPVGATYLANASSSLRTTTLPVVSALTDANSRRADAELDFTGSGLALALVGALALVVLVLALVYLATRTHRYVNVPLTVGVGLVVVGLLAGALAVASVRGAATGARTVSVQATKQLSAIRYAAFDAKANESLTIIAQGPAGAPYEKTWAADATTVTDTITALPVGGEGLTSAWTTYAAAHRAIRQLDDGGRYDAARAATGATGAGSANAAFEAFATAVAQRLDGQQAAASAALTDPRDRTAVVGWLVLLTALAAAALALRGFGQRLEEYR